MSERLLLASIKSSYLRRFCFRTDQYLFKIPNYFRAYQNSSPSLPGSPYFFTWNKYYWGKNYTNIKRVHYIFFIKYVNYFHKTPQGSEYARVLNIPKFSICLWLWRCQSPEYPKVLNIPRLYICLWFWICQGSEYVRLNRVLNMPDYVWLNLHKYVWNCQYLREYAQICLNGFCLIFPYCNALSPWTRAYLFQRLHKTRSFRLKENDAVFLETQTLIFL